MHQDVKILSRALGLYELSGTVILSSPMLLLFLCCNLLEIQELRPIFKGGSDMIVLI